MGPALLPTPQEFFERSLWNLVGMAVVWVVGLGVFWILVRMFRWWMRTRAEARAADEQIFTRGDAE